MRKTPRASPLPSADKETQFASCYAAIACELELYSGPVIAPCFVPVANLAVLPARLTGPIMLTAADGADHDESGDRNHDFDLHRAAASIN